ncbi:hypothetical protein JDS96_29845 [Bacillus cereus group sp. N21]|nr:hypothetical protein [Bacillus cereus group sp. N21]
MNKWEPMSQDVSFCKEYEAREKALMDEAAGIAHALNKGREQGLQEGKLAKRIQLVRGMHKNGMAIEDIAKFTGLRIGEIREILQP